MKKHTNVPSVWRELLFLITKIVVILASFVLLFIFVYGAVRYPEPSMNPAIKDGDLVIFYRHSKNSYAPQDVIILDHNGQRQARRVVATAGDIVDITENGLVINGAMQQEPEIFQRTQRYQDGINFPLTVPEGHVFVLADRRVDATDSRIYGTVGIDDTLGKVITVIRRRGI